MVFNSILVLVSEVLGVFGVFNTKCKRLHLNNNKTCMQGRMVFRITRAQIN